MFRSKTSQTQHKSTPSNFSVLFQSVRVWHYACSVLVSTGSKSSLGISTKVTNVTQEDLSFSWSTHSVIEGKVSCSESSFLFTFSAGKNAKSDVAHNATCWVWIQNLKTTSDRCFENRWPKLESFIMCNVRNECTKLERNKAMNYEQTP